MSTEIDFDALECIARATSTRDVEIANAEDRVIEAAVKARQERLATSAYVRAVYDASVAQTAKEAADAWIASGAAERCDRAEALESERDNAVDALIALRGE